MDRWGEFISGNLFPHTGNVEHGNSAAEFRTRNQVIPGSNPPFATVSKIADTPQFRGGNPYLFSENPYQSVSFIYASMYRENVHAIHITMQFLQRKSRHCVIQIDIQCSAKKPKSELYFTGRDRRIRPTPLID